MPASAREIAHILRLDLVGHGVGLDVGFEVVEVMPDPERKAFGNWILRKALIAGPPGDERLARVVAQFGMNLASEKLAAVATEFSASPRRVSENLVVLNSAPPEVRDAVVGVVDVLSRRLVQRRREELGEAGYGAWAAMLSDVREEDAQTRIRSAGTVVGYALRHVSYPVSKLVVVAFPTVYREIVKLKALGAPSSELRGLSTYFLFSWKQPKEGRRELMYALIGAFLRSSWPPADLVIAAMDAGIGSRVVKRVRKRPLGAKYLDRIWKDTERLDEKLRRRVRRCLSDSS